MGWWNLRWLDEAQAPTEFVTAGVGSLLSRPELLFELLDLILPTWMRGRSKASLEVAFLGVLGELLWIELVLFRSGDRLNHIGRVFPLTWVWSRIFRSAQYPSGNQTHSIPSFTGHGGSATWHNPEESFRILSFQSLTLRCFVASDTVEPRELALLLFLPRILRLCSNLETFQTFGSFVCRGSGLSK